MKRTILSLFMMALLSCGKKDKQIDVPEGCHYWKGTLWFQPIITGDKCTTYTEEITFQICGAETEMYHPEVGKSVDVTEYVSVGTIQHEGCKTMITWIKRVI